VVLDRDGTLNIEKHYLSDPSQLELLPGVIDGLKLLQRHGFGIVIMTNQSGIGRGIVDVQGVERIHSRLRELLLGAGVSIDGIYYCPHAPDENCVCRKPKPAMLYRAAAELGFAPDDAFVVGDKLSDIEMGRAVRATTMLVLTGYGNQLAQAVEQPDFVAKDLAEAAAVIVHLSDGASRNH
jgi:D-glycero-D-manno-heptose 1,7-bisphosphate phosphatase